MECHVLRKGKPVSKKENVCPCAEEFKRSLQSILTSIFDIMAAAPLIECRHIRLPACQFACCKKIQRRLAGPALANRQAVRDKHAIAARHPSNLLMTV
jgi:hypothetical protein